MTRSGLHKAIYGGDRRLRITARKFGEELRTLRLRAGVSQAAVARAIAVDRTTICRLEAGDKAISNTIRARAAAALGADLTLGLYPAASPLIHDAAHARLVETVVRLRHPSWQVTVEAPVPDGGRRSSDVRIERARDIVLIEVETHIQALEALIRESNDKRACVVRVAGDRRVHAVLVLPPTRHHRALMAAHPETVGVAYPHRSVDLRRALAGPSLDWPGDGIIWLGADRTRTGDGRRGE
jgi:transcriptional regulator with XRE-family HTH domain